MLTASVKSRRSYFRDGLTAIRGTMICALAVILLDVVIFGSYLFSALVCPIWFLAAVVLAIVRRHGLAVATARVLIPLMEIPTMMIVKNYHEKRES